MQQQQQLQTDLQEDYVAMEETTSTAVAPADCSECEPVIPSTAITEPEQIRKVFIGGLGQQIAQEHLDAYFSSFGRLTDCVVMKDPNGRSRGFGFVTFTHKHMVDSCMAARPHVIEGREVDAKRAMPKEDSQSGGRDMNVKKLFIGGIKDGLNEEDLREYFHKYGEITDCIVMRNAEGVVRGFGFVQFTDSDSVDQVVLQRRHIIKDQDLDVKKAIPRQQSRMQSSFRTPIRHHDSGYPTSMNYESPYSAAGFDSQYAAPNTQGIYNPHGPPPADYYPPPGYMPMMTPYGGGASGAGGYEPYPQQRLGPPYSRKRGDHSGPYRQVAGYVRPDGRLASMRRGTDRRY
ncbi:hypothetical protein ACOME3_003389 [Neoechinorhynchus agilis]